MARVAEKKVSVLMPAYNHGKYVEHAIRSVWNQTYDLIELIVVDDCSSDDTWAIVEQLQSESPIEMVSVRNPSNRGITGTLNTALELATGDLIAILASDDYFEPDKTAIQVEAFEEGVVCVHCDAWLVDADDNRHGQAYAVGTLPPAKNDAFKTLAKGGCRVLPVSIMVDGELARELQFDENLRAEDFDFHLRLSKLGRYRFVDQPLVNSRELPGSLGRSPDRYLLDMFAALEKHEEALGVDYPVIMRHRAILGANLSLAHGYREGFWESAKLGVEQSDSLKSQASFVARLAVIGAVITGRSLVGSHLPAPMRKLMSKSYQKFVYGRGA